MADNTPTPQEQRNEPWRLLGTLPSTNWKIVSGTGVLWLTALFYFLSAWTGRDAHMVPTMWDSWLFFVATGVLGVNAAQFVAKRMTYKPGAPDAARGAAANPSPEAEAERDRAAAVETARVTAEQPVVVPTAGADPGALLDVLQEEARKRSMATYGPSGAPPAAGLVRSVPAQPPGQGD